MYKDVPDGSDARVDNVYLVAHGISPEGSPQPGEPHVPLPETDIGVGLPDHLRHRIGLITPVRDRVA
jgi:hypothetical protein